MGVRRSGRLLAASVALLAATAGLAQEIAGYPANVYLGDRREMALVPKFCAHTQVIRDAVPGGNNPQMINAWTAQFGPIFHHLHHYCVGLIKANRGLLLARDAATRRFYLSDAVVEYDYVISRSADDFILLPEIHTKKGEALVHLDRGALAVFEFERAIELKADYWPPYAHLSDYYKKSGDLRKAREVLDNGLAKVPDAKALQRRVAELGTGRERPISR